MIGKFSLKDLPPGEKGQVRVIVTIFIDADNRMHVTAEQEDDKKNVSDIQVNMQTFGIADQDVRKMLDDSDNQVAKEAHRAIKH